MIEYFSIDDLAPERVKTYLGRVLDQEKGIFWRKAKGGAFTYDVETNTYGPAPEGYEQGPKRKFHTRRRTKEELGEIQGRYISYQDRNTQGPYAILVERVKVPGEKRGKNVQKALGRVLDEEKGIFKSRERGIFTYDLATNTYGPAPEWALQKFHGEKIIHAQTESIILKRLEEDYKLLSYADAQIRQLSESLEKLKKSLSKSIEELKKTQ